MSPGRQQSLYWFCKIGRILYLELSDRSEIRHTPRQHCCRCAFQISKRCDNSNCQSRGFETSRDPTTRRLTGYWDRAQQVLFVGGPQLPLPCRVLWWYANTYRFSSMYMIKILWNGISHIRRRWVSTDNKQSFLSLGQNPRQCRHVSALASQMTTRLFVQQLVQTNKTEDVKLRFTGSFVRGIYRWPCGNRWFPLHMGSNACGKCFHVTTWPFHCRFICSFPYHIPYLPVWFVIQLNIPRDNWFNGTIFKVVIH